MNGKLSGLVVVIVIALIIMLVFKGCGVGGWGSERTVVAKVVSKHVDSGNKSHYMVTTDQGTFEVDNGLLLGVWNSDEIYGRLEIGTTYQFVVQGSEYKNMFAQYYPYVLSITKK